MKARPMSVGQFTDCLDQYGEDLAAWPEKQRSQAREILATSETARNLLADALARGQALRGSVPKAPPVLVDRILQAAGVADSPAKKGGKRSLKKA